MFGASLWWAPIDFVVAFIAAFLVGSFAEYVVHRMSHFGWVIVDIHANHHLTNISQGVWREFRGYWLPAVPFMGAGFLVSIWAGIGGVVGATVFALVAAYAHQLSHEAPDLIFWQRVPVHYVHHRYGQSEVNFGIAVDWWDRLFGTFAVPVRAAPHRRLREIGWRELLDVAWREPEISKAFRPLLARYGRLPLDLPEVIARRQELADLYRAEERASRMPRAAA